MSVAVDQATRRRYERKRLPGHPISVNALDEREREVHVKIEGSVILVTGSNRGLGLEFARQAQARGAAKVYAAARDPSTITMRGVVPIKLDVTDQNDVAAAAALCKDVTLLINNAGIARPGGVVNGDSASMLRLQMETNFFGLANVSNAFAGILGRNGGGAMLNILSCLSWVDIQKIAGYCVTKAAAWALTNALRNALRAQGTLVVGVHPSFIDTDFSRGIDMPKATTSDVVNQSFDAVAAGQEEVLIDTLTRGIKNGLSQSIYLNDVFAG